MDQPFILLYQVTGDTRSPDPILRDYCRALEGVVHIASAVLNKPPQSVDKALIEAANGGIGTINTIEHLRLPRDRDTGRPLYETITHLPAIARLNGYLSAAGL